MLYMPDGEYSGCPGVVLGEADVDKAARELGAVKTAALGEQGGEKLLFK